MFPFQFVETTYLKILEILKKIFSIPNQIFRKNIKSFGHHWALEVLFFEIFILRILANELFKQKFLEISAKISH